MVKSNKPLNCASALTETDDLGALCVHVECVCACTTVIDCAPKGL